MKRGPEDDESSEEVGKRKKKAGGFSNSGPPPAPDDGPSAELQLDQMLSGAMAPPAAGLGGLDLLGMNLGGSAAPPLDPNKPATTPMDFSRLGSNLLSESVKVPVDIVEYVMTPENRQILLEETGADAEWAPDESKVHLRGSAEQIKKASRLLQRVLMHCNWGKSEAKVRRLLKPRMIESAALRLSPMNTLPSGSKTLSLGQPQFSIGKISGNDLVIPAQILSRQHCVLELDPERGAIYAIDCSTNGTFLNGLRLPPKTSGKVLVSHGDELLLCDPATGEQEFGYIISIQELHVKEQMALKAPRRILDANETGTRGRDFQ